MEDFVDIVPYRTTARSMFLLGEESVSGGELPTYGPSTALPPAGICRLYYLVCGLVDERYIQPQFMAFTE
ncbi:hypothetical protein SNK04_010653 [Fusarium graminearum]